MSINVMGATGQLSRRVIEVLLSMYRAVDNGEFEAVTDHVERLTSTPPEIVESYLSRVVRKA